MAITISFRDKLVITLVLSAIVLSSILSIAVYFIIMHKYHVEIHEKAKIEADRYKSSYAKIVDDAKLTLRYLHEAVERDPNGFARTVHDTVLKKECLLILQTRREIMQIRVLDARGFERLRVERDSRYPVGRITPDAELTDKSHRYYVKRIFDQPKGKPWVSNLDLNIEHHAIEVPYRPTLRVGKSVYRDGKLVGLVIINLDISVYLQQLARSTMFTPILADQEGEILIHPNPEFCWSRSLGHKHDLFGVYPGLPGNLFEQENHYYKEHFLYIEKFYQNEDSNETLWLLLFPINNVDAYAWTVLQIILIINLMLIPVHMLAAYLISKGYRRLEQTQKLQEELLIQKSKMSSIGEMISFISHQWRQPLNAMAGTLMRARTDIELDRMEKHKLVTFMDQEEQRLQYLSETIETFRRFYTPDKEDINFALKEAVNQVLELMEPTLKEEDIALELQLEKDGVLRGRKNEFMQVMLSIINNARHIFGERKTSERLLQLHSFYWDGKLCLEIRDNGGGIATDPVEKIFAPYFSTHINNSGTGVGLYLSRLIIEQHFSGTLEARNDVKGAVFMIALDV